MASWQARCAAFGVRVVMRRRDWGDERALTHRARRVFGAPRVLQWLRTRDVGITAVDERGVVGEWITPRDAGAAVVLYCHGGGYVAGSPATDRPITAALARLTGRRVFSLDYRLAPEHRFPAAVDDAVVAYRWLLEQGIAPASIALAGASAGGGLVLGTVIRLRDERVALPGSVVCFSPFTDLAGTGESLRTNDGRCMTLRDRNIPDFAAVYLGGASSKHPWASPVFADLAGLPPVLLQVGSIEVLLDDARRVHDGIVRAGGVSRLRAYDDLFHVWQMLDGFVPEAAAALREAAAFISDPTR